MTQVVTFDFGGKFNPNSYQNLLHSLKNVAKHSQNVLVLGCREEDCNPSAQYAQTLELQKYIHNLGMQFCVFFNHYTQYAEEHMPEIDVHYLDFMLLKTIYNAATPMPAQGQGILFLIAKPDRPHRAPLLYKFYEREQLHKLTWSLFLPTALQKKVRDLIPSATDQQWENFVNLQRSPDHMLAVVSGDSVHIPNSFHYDRSIFARTNVSLVSESTFELDNLPVSVRATEKTYKAIDNRHPFVIAGQPGTLARLQSLGYRTFENYLPHADYDQEVDSGQRLEMIYENILFLHNLTTTNPAVLAKDVEHNWMINQQRYQHELERAASVLAKYGYVGPTIDCFMMHDQFAPNDLTEKFMKLDNK